METAIAHILATKAHPYAKLNELHQINQLLDLQKTEEGSPSSSTVSITARIDIQYSVQCTKVAKSLKIAKMQAAEEVLTKVIAHVSRNSPRLTHPIPIICPNPSAGTKSLEIGVLTPAMKRQMFEDREHLQAVQELIQCWKKCSVGLLSVDLEQYEQNHSINLEIGVAFFSNKDYTLRAEHIVNADALHLRNGLYCADERDNFDYGHSQLVSKDELSTTVIAIITRLTHAYERILFVGHSIQSDLKWLRNLGVPNLDQIEGCDIGRVWRALKTPNEYCNLTGMRHILKSLGIKAEHLHNGGNDAVYNLFALDGIISIMEKSNKEVKAD